MADAPENEMICGKGCQRIEVPTQDEIEALDAMRHIKEKVRDLKKRISKHTSSNRGRNEEIKHLEMEIEHLREEWNALEEKRKEAARVRMILLGHEKPDR